MAGFEGRMTVSRARTETDVTHVRRHSEVGVMRNVILCTPKSLPRGRRVETAQRALEINPANRPLPTVAARALAGNPMDRERLAMVVGHRWPAGGIKLTVGFLDDPPPDLKKRILLHMNAWAKTANVAFVASSTDPMVRIARLDDPPEMAGYWSYVGTEILSLPKDEPTMNLEGFTMNTLETEFHRVVRHEAGHTLGFPHEQMRRELVERIDPEKAIKYFGKTQHWWPAEVREQVLTPLEDASLLEAGRSNTHSIMCYQIPGIITKDGKPILGGIDIDKQDYEFAAACYPKGQ
jgi:hypothetical protein